MINMGRAKLAEIAAVECTIVGLSLINRIFARKGEFIHDFEELFARNAVHFINLVIINGVASFERHFA